MKLLKFKDSYYLNLSKLVSQGSEHDIPTKLRDIYRIHELFQGYF